jgi:hypothetical protein
MELLLKNQFGVRKKVRLGFSWFVFFLGPIANLVYENYGLALIQFVINCIVGAPIVITMLMIPMWCVFIIALLEIGSAIVFGCISNKRRMKRLLDMGFRPVSDDGTVYLKSLGYDL